ncbi:hypothetical protein [Actinobaculum sp. 313]|uniref:hypothetical protein n=1 Tax=Actinobaculum sp. 313 TaxID=2495645 RepID=UPI000D527A1D|nr:hypothetical protein [Actinobaculum sp. 313]AWE43120.1 hypothetical protein DDD63_10625 [Actinobaculum sp. 313]
MASREQRRRLEDIAAFDPNQAYDLSKRLGKISEGFEGLRGTIGRRMNPDDLGIRGAAGEAFRESMEGIRRRIGRHADDTKAMSDSCKVVGDAVVEAQKAHNEISADTQASDGAYAQESRAMHQVQSADPTGLTTPVIDARMSHVTAAYEARDSGFEEKAGRMVDYVGEEVDRAIRMLPRSEKAAPRSYVTYMPPSSSGVDSSVTGLPSDGGASYAAALAEGRPTDTDPDLDVSDGGGSVVPSVGAVAAGVGVSGSLAWMFSWYAGERVEGMVGTPQGRMIRADSAEARYLYGPGEGI